MKKLGLIFLLSLITVFCIISVVHAEDQIIETPNVKIVIDGKLTSYTDVPLSMNQRTLLPLRELLTNLGVKNDDEHIIWNGSEKSVTVYKGGTKIYLKINSKTVYVNDIPIEMDVAPIGYVNQRVYIPARFVSEALGKKIVWDGSSKTVLIRDESEFNQIKNILEKSELAMQSISKCKFAMDVVSSTFQKNFNMNMEMKMSGEVDTKSKSMHVDANMNMLGMNIGFNSYFDDGSIYIENPFTGEWQKSTLPEEEYDSMFDDNCNVDLFDATDPLCAGLVITDSSDPNEILLKGNVYLGEFFNQVSKKVNGEHDIEPSSGYDLDEFYVEMSIDKNTYLLNSITMTVKADAYDSEDASLNMSVKAAYTDYDGDFEIVVPKEVLENAVEVENPNL